MNPFQNSDIFLIICDYIGENLIHLILNIYIGDSLPLIKKSKNIIKHEKCGSYIKSEYTDCVGYCIDYDMYFDKEIICRRLRGYKNIKRHLIIDIKNTYYSSYAGTRYKNDLDVKNYYVSDTIFHIFEKKYKINCDRYTFTLSFNISMGDKLNKVKIIRMPSLINLNFLKYCDDLEILYINQIENYYIDSINFNCDKLRSLTINTFYRYKNLSFLENLTNLEYLALTIYYMPFPSLNKFKKIKEINFSCSKFSNFSNLKLCNLKKINLRCTNLSKLSDIIFIDNFENIEINIDSTPLASKIKMKFN
jgi:hypothetical protein